MTLKDNSQCVVSDVIDGETVLLHLQAGHYFSLSGAASALWACLLEGIRRDQLLQALQEAYPQEPVSRLEADLQAWLERLKLEDLIQEVSDEPRARPCLQGAYEPPALEKYSDLQDLLLLDPIHETDAAGWPALPH